MPLSTSIWRCSRRLFAVTVDRHPHATLGQLGDARPLLLAEDRVGEADVIDADRGERFGLANLGAADAPGAGAQLQQRDLRHLVGLHVDPEPDPALVHPRLPVADVPLHPVEVREDQGCIQVFDMVTDLNAWRTGLVYR